MNTNILDIIGSVLTLIQINDNVWSSKEWDSLRIWVDTQSWYRFSRGVGGDAEAFIRYYNHEYDETDFSLV